MWKVIVVGIGLVAALAGCSHTQQSSSAGTPAPAGTPPTNIQPGELEPLRTAGTKLVVPDDEDKVSLGMGGARLVGSFKLCLDTSGHHAHSETLRSTGLPGYDEKILTELKRWAFHPYVKDGVAMPVCTAVTFIYTQR